MRALDILNRVIGVALRNSATAFASLQIDTNARGRSGINSPIYSRTSVKPVRPSSAHQNIVAIAARKEVSPIIAHEGVIPGTALKIIVAAET